jgi:hypothetical protein
MGRILLSDDAHVAAQRLSPETRAEIEKRLDYLESMPRMYAIADDERFPGCRSFWVEPATIVYYMVAAGGDDCYIVAIVDVELEERLLG